MKKIDSYWFTSPACRSKVETSIPNTVIVTTPIGVVLGFCPDRNLFCAYIGNGVGQSQEKDEDMILKNGSKLTHAQAVSFFPHAEALGLGGNARFLLRDNFNYKS